MKAKLLLPEIFLTVYCVFSILPAVQAKIYPVVGGYNVYFGSLHNHTSASDGTGTAAAAYTYARNTAQLDFFGLADHSNMVTSSEWSTIKSAANAANAEGVFTAFYGFEWTTFFSYGHVAVINTEDILSGGNFSQLISWVNARNGIAFFNHPGWDALAFNEFNHFTDAPATKFVGMELWNDKDGFGKYYYNDGFYRSDGNKGYFDEALIRKWKIGAAGSDDNHTSTWGTSTQYRVGVLANNLSRTAILEAFNSRRFFATLDKNIALSFKINGAEMGSTIPGGSLNAVVTAFDGDNEAFSKVVLVKNGADFQTVTLNPYQTMVNLSLPITCTDGDYFYVRVTQSSDGNEAISSPIFISGTANQPPAVSIISPESGASYEIGQTVAITASATDADGTISKVEFYNGGTYLSDGILSSRDIYTCELKNAAAGSYTLTARATDNLGASATSSGVSITVKPVNLPPTVSVMIPVNGDSFAEGQPVNITATAGDTDGNVVKVDFYLDNVIIGTDTSSPYTCSWSGASAGTHSITAVATDNSGAVTTSTGVSITVTPASTNKPPSVNITSPANNAVFNVGQQVNITADANDTDGSVALVEFFQGSTKIGQATSVPFELLWDYPFAGTYSLTAKATDNLGATTTSATVLITVNPVNVSVDFQISNGSNDAEEYYSTGTVVLNHNTLNIVYESSTSGNQTVGLLFSGIYVPQGVTITKAYIQFTASGQSTTKCALVLKAEDIDNPLPFTNSLFNISGRTLTTASINWSPSKWNVSGARGASQQTPDIKTIIQEIVSRGGWSSGNSIAIIFKGTGSRIASAYDGAPASAPSLHIEYTRTKSASLKAVSQAFPSENSLNASQVQLYPNPVRELLTLRFTPETQVEQIMVYSMTGSLVKTMNFRQVLSETEIDCSGLLPGTYLISVQTKTGKNTLRFIKQ